ncbi:MAG: oxidoreductase [Hydrocarboniphaga sp.]|uniref:Gfo/Idh/MocA family protein n=1 Tax=Hydrocarboniphaga sp. TaxID=2033016 RepID=UPI002635BF25|nr:Gfo/Idh/MocA family oxidoreductase [Hydrocarboniphaga sp.]MDB5968693.1 oxidoreductase [Hydrocarboniphaga sp.]
MTGRISAVVVGTGFGCRIHVPALRAAGFEVLGLVGADAERTRRRADTSGVPQAYTDLDEAITRTGAKVVSIATPPDTHAALTLAALSRGCHVICEKPFAMNLAEARAMLAAAERARIVHLVAHEFRWGPDRALVARAIAEGLIGEPRLLTMTSYSPQLASLEAKMPPWWFDPQSGGGWLGAHGAHIIDQVRCWLGEFASLSAALPMVSERRNGAEDSYSLSFALANGVQGVVQQTAGAWGPSASMTRVAGTRGTLWVEDGKVRLADRDGTRELPVPPEFQLPPPSDDPRQSMPYLLGPFIRLCEALRSAMEGGATSAVPLPTFADGVAGMEVLDAVRTSAASGGALVRLR